VSVNSIGPYSGNPEHRDEQVKPSGDERGLFPKTLLPSWIKKSKGNSKAGSLRKRRKYEMHKVLRPSPKAESRNPIMGNAMHLIWPNDRVLLIHPPIPLILRALRKFEKEGCTAVVVVPDWKGQIWTPLLKECQSKS
jgi:hypothetical protein